MAVLQALHINKSYGITPILTNLSLQVHDEDKIGIVGPNGAGKSTFLKILAGRELQDQGDIIVTRDKQLCYLAQDSGLDSERTVWDEMLSVFASLHSIEQEIRRLEIHMGVASSPQETLEAIMEQYSILQERFEREGGYKFAADIRNVLAGLGFGSMNYKEHLVKRCSGGQKTRLALAKILLSNPDLILLDEPTNYLDIDALSWLEQFIKDFEGAVLVVSHDRYFLDTFVTAIYEIDQHVGTRYEGNYSFYLSTKEQRLIEHEKRYVQQQQEIAKAEDFIQRNIVRATTSSRAQSRRKQLEKIERIEAPKQQSKTFFTFQTKKRTGNLVLDLQCLEMQFEENGQQRKLFQNLSLQVERGDRIGIIGPNGIGKSTLLKIIAGRLTPVAGNVQYGSNLLIGYYDQEQADLTLTNTIFDEVHNDFPNMTKTEIRSALAQFLFTGDEVEKKIVSLSGGEKARVTLTKLMLAQDNLLLLDEPTNHLDIQAKEALESALTAYDGTMLFISHDRYFLNTIANKIVHFSQDQLTVYLGNYDYYLEKIQEKDLVIQREDSVAEQKETHEEMKRRRNTEKQLTKQYEKVEADIQQTEEEIANLENELCNPEIFDDHEKVTILNQKLTEKQQQLNQLLEKWELLANELQ
ncbi:hypothetical protein BHU72_06365 [Desulfuribacillus stibiiarsenatis]|uniref:ABC transporter domain-containing protein n=1 Tax=Desulfuribacillus stibiiarsenatis TaxID=1390249 RepID=A0A1E5L518_9FIRM|nr:ABC-F family ATP-binding cassette domain-containing protein [Desulfuribacillus stibiiarsenatis]OEH85225.1 hypothetical protein BHU72_06365 [Desulfuribacillus stibiiarsenatis]